VKIDSASSAMQDVVSGVPQGSVLGPVMFLVYISDVTLQLRSSHALFADDCKIYAIFAKPNEIKSGLSLAAVQTWCDVLKMKLNIEKCSVLHIRVNNPKTNYSIVATVQQQKNLGSTLCWREHVAVTVRRANFVTCSLKKSYLAKSRTSSI
jgi:ribonuclease P/MRP protein subunit RPP40